MAESRDASNVATATGYDALGRPTLVTTAAGTGDELQTSFEYSDQDRYVITTTNLAGTLDGPITIQRFDPLGRTRLHQLLDSGPERPAFRGNAGGDPVLRRDDTNGVVCRSGFLCCGRDDSNQCQAEANGRGEFRVGNAVVPT